MVYNVGVALSTQRCAPFLLLERHPNLEKHLKYNPPLPYPMTAHKALLILAMLTALFYPSDALAQELNSREKSDLVIFRTKDYALMEHSTLESLLNMLPGIRVDKKGNISLNFDNVVEILVDGVEIFGETGDAFDPNLHNAVMHTEDENFGENTICQVFQKGFLLGDKVIRFATVQVAN